MQHNTPPVARTLVIDALIFKNGKSYGYQEYLFNLLDYLREYRNALYYGNIVLACPKSKMAYFSKYKDVFNICGFAAESKLQHISIQNRLETVLGLKKDDVVLFTYNYSCLTKHCCHVLVVHDLLFLRKKYLPDRLMRLQRRLFVPVSLKLADCIIAISHFTKSDIVQHYRISESKVFTIYNYFNFGKYKPIAGHTSYARPYFVSICSTAYHKNTISVLQAFSEFCAYNNTHDMVFIGSLTDTSSAAFNTYKRLPPAIKQRVHLLNDISNGELGLLYRNAACFISLTLFEGLGMPIVEAMYFNLPVILSDIPICREIAGQTSALFVRPFDISGTVKAMLSVVSNQKKPDTSAIIQTRFSETNTSQKYINLLNTL